MNYTRTITASLAALLLMNAPALATTGKGCLRVVNVDHGDVLNIRSLPSASSRVSGRIHPETQGVIVLNSQCTPMDRPWAQRWCPITSYGDGTTLKGWVKARYVRDNDCP